MAFKQHCPWPTINDTLKFTPLDTHTHLHTLHNLQWDYACPTTWEHPCVFYPILFHSFLNCFLNLVSWFQNPVMGCNQLFEKYCLLKPLVSLTIIFYKQHDVTLCIKCSHDTISLSPLSIINNPILSWEVDSVRDSSGSQPVSAAGRGSGRRCTPR